MPYPCQPEQGLLYTAEQTRELDRLAIDAGTPGFDLMKSAARAAYRALRRQWPEAGKLCILCGPGNNGGDGLVMAALAREQHLQVDVRLVGDESAVERLRGEARDAWELATEKGVTLTPCRQPLPDDADVVVDALLGTGLQGQVRTDYASLIEAVNKLGTPVLSVDIPSGLCSDTGAVLGCAIRADMTLSFIGLKRGLLTHRGPDHCGRLLFADLNVGAEIYHQVPSALSLIDQALLRRVLAPRPRGAHKGDFGHLLVVGGDYGMAGAVIMAATAAARSGAGLVSVATRNEHVTACNIHCPEVMAHGVRSGQDLEVLLDRATTVLIGPGLGQSAWSGQLLRAVQQRQLPMVLDADALNLLSQGTLIDEAQRDNWVLTPHPGEAARLLEADTAGVQRNRFAAVISLQARYGGVAVLKGAGSLIADGQQTRLCNRGNPGMASGGMGDVLAGLLGGLLAQRLTPMDAACTAVQVHAMAADRAAAASGERGLLATDLLAHLRILLNLAAELADD